jgi:hypothetical protein
VGVTIVLFLIFEVISFAFFVLATYLFCSGGHLGGIWVILFFSLVAWLVGFIFSIVLSIKLKAFYISLFCLLSIGIVIACLVAPAYELSNLRYYYGRNILYLIPLLFLLLNTLPLLVLKTRKKISN